jgi:hypothetical protein
MADDPNLLLQLDHVAISLEAAIDQGVWREVDDGICEHCYSVGTVFEANGELMATMVNIKNPANICKECLIHRTLWNAYLDIYP